MPLSNAETPRTKADPVDPTHQARALGHQAGPGLRSSPRPADTIEEAQGTVPRAEPADTYMVDSGGDVTPDDRPDGAHHPVTDQPERGRAALFGIIGLGILALIAIVVFTR